MMQDGNETTTTQERPARPGSGVGYKNPPVETRFKPGKSGCRRGRPRGSRGRKQIVQEIAAETHVVIEDGKRRRRTTLDLVLLSLRNSAAQGNVSAFRVCHELLQRYAPQQATERPSGRIILPEVLTVEEWEERMKLERERERKAKPSK